MASRISITGGLAAAVRFLGPAWRGAWGAMLLATLVIGMVLVLRLWSPMSAWRLQGLGLSAIVVLLVEGGLYRLALGRGVTGLAGLGWVRADWRLGAVWGLAAVFLFVLALLAFVVLLSFAFAVASSGRGFVVALPMTWGGAVDGRGRMVVEAVGALCLSGLVWAGTRVSLGSAATIDTDRVMMLSSWPDTRGRVVAIVLARLCLGVASIGVAGAILVAIYSVPGPTTPLVWAGGLVAGAAIVGLWLPLNVGLMTYFYQSRPTS